MEVVSWGSGGLRGKGVLYRLITLPLGAPVGLEDWPAMLVEAFMLCVRGSLGTVRE